MWFFRKLLEPNGASVSPVRSEDLNRVSRLLRDGARRYYGLSNSDLTTAVTSGHGAVLTTNDELWAVALVSRPTVRTCWLRAVALAHGLELRSSLETLIIGLHNEIRARGVREIFFGGDEISDNWLLPGLEALGYARNTEVVVYEKRDLHIPHYGRSDVQVRPAQSVDLAEVIALDQLCFEPQWTKDDTVLSVAIKEGPFFVVAELKGEIVGYAYATSHFAGRLMHLVRIAVNPKHQGKQIGVRLLAELVSYAAAGQTYSLTLNTQSYNTHAQRLYRWFGFMPTGERQLVLRSVI